MGDGLAKLNKILDIHMNAYVSNMLQQNKKQNIRIKLSQLQLSLTGIPIIKTMPKLKKLCYREYHIL